MIHATLEDIRRKVENENNVHPQTKPTDIPTFPIECLPDTVKNLAKEVARTRLLPPDLPASLALATASAAIGKGLELDIPPHRTRANLYLLATARSGTGKSDCFRDVVAAFRKAEKKANEVRERDMHRRQAKVELLEADMKKIKGNSEENVDRLAELKEKHAEALKGLQPIRYMIEDSTEPAMKRALASNREQIALFSAECGQVISNLLGRYGDAKGGTSETLMLKGFSGDPDIQNRIGSGETRLESPCISAALIVTPDKMEEMYSNQRFVEGGLMPRFLLATTDCKPKRDDGQNRRPEQAVLDRWEQVILELVETCHRAQYPAVIKCDPEALELFRNYWNREFVECFEEIESKAAYYSRHREQAIRIALILHALRYGSQACDKPLEGKTAEDALGITRWFVSNQEAAILRGQATQFHSLRERVEEAFKEHGKDTEAGLAVTFRTLKRSYHVAEEDAEKLAEDEPGTFKVVTTSPKGGGRPSKQLVQV